MSTMESSQNDVGIFLKTTSYNVLLQIAFRSLTFFVNAILLHLIPISLLGVVNVRLMLLYGTVYYFSREPFRRSCLQREENSLRIQTINVIPAVSFCLSLLCTFIWVFLLRDPSEDTSTKYYGISACIYALSTVIETFAEPLCIIAQNLKQFHVKMTFEAIQMIIRQFFSLLLVYFFPNLSLLAFAFGMIVSSSAYAVLYYLYFLNGFYKPKDRQVNEPHEQNAVSVFPQFSKGFDSETLTLVYGFWKHGMIKQFLTEGERYVMTFFNLLNFRDQGVFDVVSNLGSLVARIVLAPLEENAYIYFSQHLIRGMPEEFAIVHDTFSNLLKLVSLIGLTSVVFGQAYSYPLLKLYGGRSLIIASGPSLLRMYSFYVFLIALNGITECFMFSIMRLIEVDRHKLWLFYFCLVFLFSAVLLCQLFGSIGFIMANCINMIFRVVYSCWFIARFYRGKDSSLSCALWNIIPSFHILSVMLISLFATSISSVIFCCDGFFNTTAHIVIGGLLFALLFGSVYNSEPQLIIFAKKFMIKSKQEKILFRKLEDLQLLRYTCSERIQCNKNYSILTLVMKECYTNSINLPIIITLIKHIDIQLHTICKVEIQLEITMTDAKLLAASGVPAYNPHEKISDGTTLVACEFEHGVMIAADTRTSSGTLVVSRVSNKISPLSEYICCMRSGSSADTQAVADIAKYQISVYEMEHKCSIPVSIAAEIFRSICYRYRNDITAGIIVCGWDSVNGGQIYSIPISGMIMKQCWTAGGSGSVYAIGYLDTNFKPNMTEEEAKNFIQKALAIAITRDGSSGGCIRLCSITEKGMEHSLIPADQVADLLKSA
ncbi:Protein RFT1 -like protein [Trichinella papuae]|uniref:Man(5)GlcNAc(2)-PP-dolichol translocation protein RFT1 n=1 Tax=Trichinella papuae TaxID=268474 RepID=A0A0V1N576_9BILA|nr:Protein RFT1 -like protein [Trichinella papuae]